jgi:hypothetical protein
MQYCSATICIAGDVLQQVRKHDLSVPEIALMVHLHGDDGVKDVAVTNDDRKGGAGFKKKLLEKYGQSPRTADEINKLWPGLNPVLPTQLGEIGYERDVKTMDIVRSAEPERVTGEDLGIAPEEAADDGSTYAAEDAAKDEDEDEDEEAVTERAKAMARVAAGGRRK